MRAGSSWDRRTARGPGAGRAVHRRVVPAALLVGLLAMTTVPGAAAGPPGGPQGPGEPAVAGGPGSPAQTVTLVTGDRVSVVTGADGQQQAVLLPDPSDPSPGAVVRRVDGELVVIPTEALPLLRSGGLDRDLFNVTRLLALDLDDESTPTLSLLAAAPASPLASGAAASGRPADAAPSADATPPADAKPPAPPEGSEAGVAVASLGLRGLTVAKDDARRFWADVAAVTDGADARLTGGIGRIWLDRPVRRHLDRSVRQIGAPAAYAAGLDGSGTTVAVLDGGVDDENPDVAGRVRAQQDFTGEGTTDDLEGHGTHVASIIAGTGEASGGRYAGVAPGAQLLDARVLDATGSGLESWAIAGMEWAAREGADIANVSLGGPPTDGTDPLAQAVGALTREYGTLFVVSAGNDAVPGSVGTPGVAPEALTVGSATREDGLSEFSSRGPALTTGGLKPEISAPGEDIVAAQADGTELGPVAAPGYVALSGTSMAAPHVAGAAALLLQQRPDATAEQLEAHLVATASPLAETTVYAGGVGRVDVAAAVDSGLAVDTGTLDLGFFPWPHGSEAPVTRTVTYTNTSTTPVRLSLTTDVTDEAGTALEAGALSVSPASLDLPPGGSAPVTLALAPAAAAPGDWSGWLTATSDAGQVLRTGLAFVSEPERYDVRVTTLDRAGAETQPFIFLANVDTGETVDTLSTADARSGLFRLAPGRWHVDVLDIVDGPPGEREVSLGALPEVVVDGATTVTVDLRDARPVRLRADDPEVEPKAFGYGYEVISPDVSFSLAYFDWETAAYATPATAATGTTLAFAAYQGLRFPEIAARVAGSGELLTPTLLTWDDRLDGDRTVRVRPLDDVGPGEVALAAVDGPPGELVPVDDVARRAAAAGAAALIVHPVDPEGELRIEGPTADVPVVALPADEGSALQPLAAAGTLDLKLSGQFFSPRVYEVGREWPDGIPGDAQVDVGRRDLVRVSETFRSLGAPAELVQGELPAIGALGFGALSPAPPEGRRTTYLSADFPWASSLTHVPTGAAWLEGPRTYQPHDRLRRQWLPAVLRPAVPPGSDTWAARLADDVSISLPLWVDAVGRPSFTPGTVTWRLSADGSEVASGRDQELQGVLDVAGVVPTGARELALHVQGRAVDDPSWRLSTVTDTRWTFPTEHVAGDVPADLPLLSLDTGVRLRSDNTARAGTRMSFQVTGRLPEGLDTGRVSLRSVQTSADGGATWTDARVRRVDDDTFRVTVRNPAVPAEVALRMTASTADGATVRQEVTAAWAVR